MFDLGGVLVDFVGLDRLAELLGLDLPTTGKRWLRCDAVRSYERGLISAEAYADQVTRELALPLEPHQFLEEFERWVTNPLPGALDLLETLHPLRGRGLLSACLSNTNELHADRLMRDLDAVSNFDLLCLSCRTALVKPDREAFEHCVEALDRSARNVLFLDDQPLNVAGARAAGLLAERVSGPSACRAVLERYGVLSSTHERAS